MGREDVRYRNRDRDRNIWEFLYIHEKEGNPSICNNMDET